MGQLTFCALTGDKQIASYWRCLLTCPVTVLYGEPATRHTDQGKLGQQDYIEVRAMCRYDIAAWSTLTA